MNSAILRPVVLLCVVLVSGSVRFAVASGPPLFITQSNRSFTLSIYSTPGKRYVVEATTNLSSIGTRWIPNIVALGFETNNPWRSNIMSTTAVRFFRAREVAHPITCDIYGCRRVTNQNFCPTNGPPDDPTNRNLAIPKAETPIKTVRLLFQVLSGDNIPPVLTDEQVRAAVASLNDYFRPSRIQFVFTIRVVLDDTYRELDPSAVEAEAKSLRLRHGVSSQDTHLNVFVTQVDALNVGGQAVLPWDISAANGSGIVVNSARIGSGGMVLAHEIGHALGLLHTDRGASEHEVARCSACWERADGANADRSGDFCSDTAPTPIDENGLLGSLVDPCSPTNAPAYWLPDGIGNLMSPYPYPDARLTPQQAGRMHAWIDYRLSGWLDTNTPAGPSDLRVVENRFGDLELSWIDNSWNETAFHVERSTDGTNFEQIARLPSGATSCFDAASTNSIGTTYFYRVVATNENAAVRSYSTLPQAFTLTVSVARIVYVDAASTAQTPDGTEAKPFPTVFQAYDDAPFAPIPRIIRIEAGNYPETFRLENKILRLERHSESGGNVIIGR